MSLQAMALFDAVTAPGGTVFHIAHNSRDALTAVELDKLKDTRRVWVDESLHQRLTFTAATVDFAKDFGELKLPYPHMWIEWVNHRGGDALHMAVQCFELNGRPRGESAYLVVPWVFAPRENPYLQGCPIEYDCVLQVDFDRSSRIVGVTGFQRAGDKLIAMPSNSQENRNGDGEVLASLVDLVWNGLVAIGFMNCRNVTTERVERPNKVGKKQRRPRPPKLDYHTIVLPNMRSQSGSVKGPKQDIMPMHQVRGHFKTYTAGAPLMGQHVGTYWWGWQVRGKSENGVVVSDYKVGAL